MKKILLLVYASLIFSMSYTQVWTKASVSSLAGAKGKRMIAVDKFWLGKVSVPSLLNVLNKSKQEFTAAARTTPNIITLPMPDGTFKRYKIALSSIMEDGLAAEYPEIKTYTGQGIDDRYSTIRLDYNPYFGLSAQVLSPSGSVYIDPYLLGNTEYYQCYSLEDFANTPQAKKFQCLVEDASARVAAKTAGACRGTKLFKYTIAIACTHQYAIAATGLPSPTKAQTLAKITTTLNRVNQIYEEEVAVRLILINNNSKVVFVSAASDPFTGNDDARVLIEESHKIIKDSIGLANFDIGHTFSTGAGGLAGLGVVCDSTNKGRGVTGSPSPVGDPYDVDYVAHEIGHQFGGHHTFNGTTGSCGGTTRSATTAYEPGSGTTIQAYAGICGINNIQPNTDPYFHAVSFDEISKYLDGGGNGCKVAVNTGNNIPSISKMEDNGAKIPINTPFVLTGSATDPDGDAVTYSWEQVDLGAGGDWNSGASTANAPLFKSRVPKTTGSRTFPDMAVILANYPADPAAAMGGLKGEVLPTVARDMKFTLTVRDNKAGGGGVTSGGEGCQTGFTGVFKISTVAGTGPFKVTKPNAAVTWKGGSWQTVKWDVAGSKDAPINCASVRILLSTDSGKTYPTVLVANTENDGKECIDVPKITSNKCRIKVEAVGNIFFDISDVNFTISGEVKPEVEVEKKDITHCNNKDGEATITVKDANAADFEYAVDGKWQTSNKFTGLSGGDHVATVRFKDSTCEHKKDFTIKEDPNKVSVSVSGYGTTVFCDNTNPPSVTLTASASGGSGKYVYSWPGATLTVSGTGYYSVNVTDTATGCKDDRGGLVIFVPIVCSRDPNDIIGPDGYGPGKMISKFQQHPYMIRFENDPDFATAPAQIVKINHPLDSNVNPFSLRLGDFGFGGFTFNMPANKTYHSTRIDVTDLLGYVVDLTAGIDVAKREAFWIFETKDPATGLPPANATLGFLPVNDSSGKGEGFVTYNIKPASHTQTGDFIHAEATIVFDDNAPIETPIIFNTIDALAPSSTVSSNLLNDTTASLKISALDDVGGSGVRDVDLFVSENGGPFAVYQSGITDSIITFNRGSSYNYGFFTLATDNTGNREAMKTVPATTVKFPGECPDSINIIGTAALCKNSSFKFAVDVTVDGEWSSSNTSVATIDTAGLLTAKSAGSTVIKYRLNSNGCTDSSMKTINVKAPVSISSATAQSPSICAGAKTTLTANGVKGAGAVVSWWSGPGGTGTNYGTGITLSNVGVGTYYARVTGDCGDPEEEAVTVKAETSLPVIACQSNVQLQPDSGNCTKAYISPKPLYSDDCGIASLIWKLTGATVRSSASTGINFVGNKTYNLGVTKVTYIVTDSSGNKDTCFFTVTVKDVTPPVIGSTANININAQACIKSVDIPAVSISDNCGNVQLRWIMMGATSRTGIGQIGSKSFRIGKTTITYTATDSSGNSSTSSFTVTVVETVKPTISCPANVTLTTSGGQCTKAYTAPSPVYADNCAVASLTWKMTGATVRGSAAKGINTIGSRTYNLGTTVVTYIVADSSGNKDSCSFSVTVTETIKPTIACPASINLQTGGGRCTRPYTAPSPVFSDNCGVASLTWKMTGATVKSSPSTGINLVGLRTYSIGKTIIQYTVTDSSGNTASCSFDINVNEVIASTITCPPDTTIQAAAGQCTKRYTAPSPVYSDNCGIASLNWRMTGATVKNSAATGINLVEEKTYNAGSTVVTYIIADSSGNRDTCAFTVTVTTTGGCGSIVASKLSNIDEGSGELRARLRPNPTTGFFTLSVESDSKMPVDVIIYGSDGKTVERIRSSRLLSIPFGQNYAKGVYKVEIRQEDKKTILTAIKQ